MKQELTRRQLMAAGMALGGAAVLSACGSDDDTTPAVPAGPQAKDFPYEQFIPAGFSLETARIKENAYQWYWDGACCHGVYKAVMQDLADRVGAPFTLLPLDMAVFGGGGIAGYGSICGAVLGGIMAINSIVADKAARAAIMTDLMRWYEGNSFPSYVPATVNAAEATTLDFSAGNLVNLQVVPHSHLCHASRTQWSASNGVPAAGGDLAARCGRLTADVAGKVVEQLNAYLRDRTFTAAPLDEGSASCMTCHPAGTAGKPVASGMECASCHDPAGHALPSSHPAVQGGCAACH